LTPIEADIEEEAWEQMAKRFPEETKLGFTVEPWESFDVVFTEVKRDKDGNIID